MTDGDAGFDAAHTQADARVRFDWGPTAARAITGPSGGVDVAVVVDVLSFTTTLGIAVEGGIEVFPYRWRDGGAAAYADQRDAVLAVGRFEARAAGGGVSLSPALMSAVDGVERIVLPSPNGSTIAHLLAGSGATVVGASLRNASAVAAWIAEWLVGSVGSAGSAGSGGSVAVVAAGERWPDGSLRPAVEDLWGAGAVISGLAGLGVGGFSPEARVAAAAYDAVRERLPIELAACAGGRELAAVGFAADVAEAGRLDCSGVVPLLVGESFRDAAAVRPPPAG